MRGARVPATHLGATPACRGARLTHLAQISGQLWDLRLHRVTHEAGHDVCTLLIGVRMIGAERKVILPLDRLDPVPSGHRQVDHRNILALAEVADDLWKIRSRRADVLCSERVADARNG